jgi:hypothetical protein
MVYLRYNLVGSKYPAGKIHKAMDANTNIVKASKLPDDDCKWYGVPVGSYRLNYPRWFPTEAIMGVVNGRYTDTFNIGAKISGNMGSANIAVLDLNKATKLLTDAGYTVERH